MAACLSPFYKQGETIPLPCGKCAACIGRRASQWTFRLLQQSKNSHYESYFITLTYDTRHVPITPCGYMSLAPSDLQLFNKRLRRILFSRQIPLKYYACGEYGSENNRPHYHGLYFGPSPNDVLRAWAPNGALKGEVHFGDVSGASIGYCLKYMCKPSRIPMHHNDDRVKEFANMSKGLGLGYVTDAMRDWHLSDIERLYCVLEDGKKISMPRYYKDKIYEGKFLRDLASETAAMLAVNAQAKQEQIWFDTYGTDVPKMKKELLIQTTQKMYEKAKSKKV